MASVDYLEAVGRACFKVEADEIGSNGDPETQPCSNRACLLNPLCMPEKSSFLPVFSSLPQLSVPISRPCSSTTPDLHLLNIHRSHLPFLIRQKPLPLPITPKIPRLTHPQHKQHRILHRQQIQHNPIKMPRHQHNRTTRNSVENEVIGCRYDGKEDGSGVEEADGSE